jgi:asparagine synthase (glutamine-hydrolysing)
VITHANGRVLLTGLGGDNLVLGTMFFFADWIAAGHLWPALREMAHRAALGRVSFWELAYRNALLPLLPARLRRALARDSQGAVPRWVNAAAARRFDIGSRVACDGICDGRRGHKYEDAQAALIAAIPSTLIDGPEEDALDVRHPYLHRPLVELALRLPPEMCVRPHERKWVLRESMRGILPETVRTRVGKGEADGLEAWSLTHEQRHIDRLLDDPILAQLGCIDPSTLRDSINAVRQGRPMRGVSSCRAGNTLEVELWLQLRSGRWAAEGSQHSSSERSDVK